MYIAINFENVGFPGDNGTNFDIISQHGNSCAKDKLNITLLTFLTEKTVSFLNLVCMF